MSDRCVCEGNWRALVHEYNDRIGKLYTKDGIVYEFYGLVHTKDDYYFGMCRVNSSGESILVSCVMHIEDAGFQPMSN